MYQDLKIFPTSNIDSQFKEEDFFIVLEFSFYSSNRFFHFYSVVSHSFGNDEKYPLLSSVSKTSIIFGFDSVSVV